jgi:haloacid dehalogenase-like hydrolase
MNRRDVGRVVLAATGALLLAVLIAVSAMSQDGRRSARISNADPLPSWNEGPVKQSIIDFVSRVTKEGSKDFVPVHERIATFDNDGTLWVEQPFYTQLAFVIDRIKTLAPAHPEWQQKEPFKSVLAGDLKAALASGERGIVEMLAATTFGLTTEQFDRLVTDWIATAKHPRFHRRYTDLVYQPMLELLAYLRANDFKTFIISGGGVEFMRPWTDRVYGVPPHQVVGSSGKLKFEMESGGPVLVKLPEVDFVDDKAGKPVGIERFVGQRAIAAFGNSDGDLEMLQWTTMANRHPHLGLIVHHTDAVREYAYDRATHFGKLDQALDQAQKRGWLVADMKRDWKVIFPFELRGNIAGLQ